ncbi:ABC transporter ATP-binding protein [Enterococcus sp. BWT-B8]|uniref:ABC transporter ATP-binding protein n=1 Tax=Enterococcus sp. BWT-B8 TaxID=2885157 RepID=UPI001E4F6BD0|nr:ABC transporter ATP-binding protein [Enterococcus sp. BWT-B8]MCB5951693.1 ABC transporter ATP-binding protein [Enterococcus sp. BWT-B8]
MDILTAADLTSGYGREIISMNLNTSFERGSMTSIIGPNGCGKSTLLKTLARILPELSGQILLDSKNLNQYTSKEIAQKLAILSQTPENSIDLSVFDLVSFGRHPYQKGWKSITVEDQKYIQWALEMTGLTELARESVAILSGGQRQRVWIAMALVQDTEILLLDEPTTYLDPAHQLEILNVLKMINQEQKKTIIMTIHDINLASRFSDQVIAMREGQIFKKGTPVEVITEETLRQVFSIDAEIVCHGKTKRPLVLSYEMADKENAYECEG